MLCRVPYRFVMALLGIEMALMSKAEAMRRYAKLRQSEEKQSKGKVRVRNVSALNSNVTKGEATALNSKPVEWQSIGTDMYSFGIARH